MQYKPETEKVAMMGNSYMPVLRPISLAEDHEVQRTRKIFMIIMGVFLALSAAGLVTAIFGSEMENYTRMTGRGSQIGQAITSILFYGFGLLVAHRYSEIGLRVFAWLGVICLVSLGIVVVVVLVLIVGALTAAAHVVDSEKASIGVGMPLGVIFIIAAICLAVLIVWVIIIKFAFKLARLIAANKRLSIQQI